MAAGAAAAGTMMDWRDAAAAAANVLRRLPRTEALPLPLPLLPPLLVGETIPCECEWPFGRVPGGRMVIRARDACSGDGDETR